MICGQAWFEACFRRLDAGATVSWQAAEGARLKPDSRVCEIRGKTRALLTGERTALNFLQTLSAVATATRRYADAVAGTRAKIVDTRKTLPGLRYAQKYAVRSGGGANYRMGLYDAILIKENHIAAAGGIEPVMAAAQKSATSGVWIQIEVENLEPAAQGARCRRNLDPARQLEPRPDARGGENRRRPRQLEASGGITLENVAPSRRPAFTASRSVR